MKNKQGDDINESSKPADIWKKIRTVLKPENCASRAIKIKKGNTIIEEPKETAKEFNTFFKKKVEDLVAKIKKDPTHHY